MNLRRIVRLLPILLFAMIFSGAYAQARNGDEANEDGGDPAVAERYFIWAEQAAAEGRWPEALSALERAADFAGVSSDLSYLLALARSRTGKSRGAVLEALGRALEANRWGRYSPSRARLLEAEQLIALRNYSGALAVLAQVPDSADAAVLRLAALKMLSAGSAGAVFETGGIFPPIAEFRRRMAEAMDRYPRDSRPLRILFNYAHNRNPDENDQRLMELALRRLPFVLESDPDLAWMAAPFIRDAEEARRLTAAYRAGGLGPAHTENFRPDPASIAAALKLGIIGDEEAAEELFDIPANAEPVIGKELIIAVSELLRSGQGRDLFAKKLHAFSGIITDDEDRDGYPESRILYRNGTIREYRYDADQDGLVELFISCKAGGEPQWAEQLTAPEQAGLPALPIRDEDRSRALIFWERYPAVLRAELGGSAFIPRPGDFQFAPIRFTELAGSGTFSGLMYPLREPLNPRLTLKTLVSFSLSIRRPSAEFAGAEEWIDLDHGVPLRAVEMLNGRLVSATEFENGKPVVQRVDLDLDGRMETVRRFRRLVYNGENALDYKKIVECSESDWNGDGVYETGEVYLEDGSVVYLLDMDGDGIREYSEIK
jgi:hypothetical protein